MFRYRILQMGLGQAVSSPPAGKRRIFQVISLKSISNPSFDGKLL
jgi:hypothetical protein